MMKCHWTLPLAASLMVLAAGCTREHEGRAEHEDKSPNAQRPEAMAEAGEDLAVSEDQLVRLDGRTVELDGSVTPGALGPVRVSENEATARGFDGLDRDGDGRISQREARESPGLKAVFGALDMDQNGKLNPEEFAGFEELNVEKLSKPKAKGITEDSADKAKSEE